MGSVVKQGSSSGGLLDKPAKPTTSKPTSTLHAPAAGEHVDARDPSKQPDYSGLAHHAEDGGDPIAKMLAAANSLTAVTNVHAGLAKARVAAETSVLVSSRGDTDDRRGRFRFLDSLDRIDDPAIRAQVKNQFTQQTGDTLEEFIKSADWHNEDRDKDVALDLISDERGEAETALAEKPAAQRDKLAVDAAAAAHQVLQVTRASDKDNDDAAKPLLDTLGTKSRVEIEAIRRSLRKQGERDGEHTSIYAEIDRSLSGGTEDEAVAALKGDRVASVMAGVRNADGNSDRVRELLTRLSPTELKRLRETDMRNIGTVLNAVHPSQRDEMKALVAGDKSTATAAHITDLLQPEGKDVEVDGMQLTKQSQLNLENRKPENIIAELRKLSPEQLAAARAANGSGWSDLLAARDLDATTRIRLQSLLDGDKVGEKALAIRQGMREQKQSLIEGGLANPGLQSSDAATRAAAEQEQSAIEDRVQQLDKNERQAMAIMYAEDPAKVSGSAMKEQLAHYYMRYGDKPGPITDIDSLYDATIHREEAQERRSKQAHDNAYAATELADDGKLSTTTELRRAHTDGNHDRKAELLENVGTNSQLASIKQSYAARYDGADITANPQQSEIDAMADIAQRFGADQSPDALKAAIASDIASDTDQRIADVREFGVNAERDEHTKYKAAKRRAEKGASSALAAQEQLDHLLHNKNAGSHALVQAEVENLDDSLTPADADGDRQLKSTVSKAEYDQYATNTSGALQLRKEEKLAQAEATANMFMTVVKLGALFTAQPHLVLLIDAAANAGGMALKSHIAGNDYTGAMKSKDRQYAGVEALTDLIPIGGKLLSRADDAARGASLASRAASKAEGAAASHIDDAAKLADDVADAAAATRAAEQAANRAIATNAAQVTFSGAATAEIEADQSIFATTLVRGAIGMFLPDKVAGMVKKGLGNGKVGEVLGEVAAIGADAATSGQSLGEASAGRLAGRAGHHVQHARTKHPHDPLAPVSTGHGAEHPYAHYGDDDAPAPRRMHDHADDHVGASKPRHDDPPLASDDVDSASAPKKRAAAEAIPGTSFHGNHRPEAAPEAVREQTQKAVTKHRERFMTAEEKADRAQRRKKGEDLGDEDGVVFLTDATGNKRRVRIEVSAAQTEKDAPVAHYDEGSLAGEGEIVVHISDRAADHHVSRAVAHDLAEINHRLKNPDAPQDDILTHGPLPEDVAKRQLSSHDVGRLAEVDVIGEELVAARKAKDHDAVARLQKEGSDLLQHLGLESDDRVARRDLIDSAKLDGHQISATNSIKSIMGGDRYKELLPTPAKEPIQPKAPPTPQTPKAPKLPKWHEEVSKGPSGYDWALETIRPAPPIEERISTIEKKKRKTPEEIRADLTTILTKSHLLEEDIFSSLSARQEAKVNTALQGDPILTSAGPNAQSVALRWAIDNSPGDPDEFALKYEYARAMFTERQKALSTEHLPDVAAKLATDEVTPENLSRWLEADIRDSNQLAQNTTVAPLTNGTSPESVFANIKTLGRVAYPSPTSEAYHARKHQKELPPGKFEDGGNMVTNFHDATQDTIINADHVTHETMKDGSIRFVAMKAYPSNDGKPPRVLEAILFVEPDGRVTIRSFGNMKTDEGRTAWTQREFHQKQARANIPPLPTEGESE